MLLLKNLKNNVMETKEVKITAPDGYEIDKENSTFDCIKFKKKEVLTYEEVSRKLFSNGYYFINSYGEIVKSICRPTDLNNATSERQLQKLLAINMLMNVANYLNDGWKPNWNNANEPKYYLRLFRNGKNVLETEIANVFCSEIVYFKSKNLAYQAINILGEDTICLALSTDW